MAERAEHGGRRAGAGRPLASIKAKSRSGDLLRLITSYHNVQWLLANADAEWTPQSMLELLIENEAKRIRQTTEEATDGSGDTGGAERHQAPS